MLAGVWARLRDRQSAVDSSFSMVHVTKDYAANFYDMYVDKHEGKHLTGDRVRILLLLLPFFFGISLCLIWEPDPGDNFCSFVISMG